MTREIISWAISTKLWDRVGIELAAPGSAVRCAVNRLASVAIHVTNCATRPGLYLIYDSYIIIVISRVKLPSMQRVEIIWNQKHIFFKPHLSIFIFRLRGTFFRINVHHRTTIPVFYWKEMKMSMMNLDYYTMNRPLVKNVYEKNTFLNQNICCGYSKEPSRLKLIGKKNFTILRSKFLFIIFSQKTENQCVWIGYHIYSHSREIHDYRTTTVVDICQKFSN